MTAHSDIPPSDLVALIHRYMTGADTVWGIASFGAIAQFQWDHNAVNKAGFDPSDRGGTAITGSGGLRIALTPDTRFVPYEILTKRPGYWMQGGNFCLPQSKARQSRAIQDQRTLLTEIGPDEHALRDQDRSGILFDLGLGLACITAMVRTSDTTLIQQLRGFEGASLLSPEGRGKDAFALLVQQGPHRVFESPLGRVEVYAPIPQPDGQEGAVDGEHGCHTHILPELLSAGQTHSANVPVPDGYVPCLQIFPANPILTATGDVRTQLDRDGFDAFQTLLNRYGLPELVAAKQLAQIGVETDAAPPDSNAFNRAERTAIRIALRQIAYQSPNAPHLGKWLSMFEPQAESDG
jgi:hypothetical protein